MADEVVNEYQSSLDDLTFNSKPLINMLTMLADDNVKYAAEIVQVIEAHIKKVQGSRKLSALYLVDSIIKNVSNSCYPQLFSKNLASIFVAVFEKVDEKTRASMYKLRQTWTSIFPNNDLYALDIGVSRVDPAWPTTATEPTEPVVGAATGAHNIHVNPKFIMKQQQQQQQQQQKQKKERDKRDQHKRPDEAQAAKMVEALRRQQAAILAHKQEELRRQQKEEEAAEQARLEEELRKEERLRKEEQLKKEEEEAAFRRQLAAEEQRRLELEQRLLREQREAEAAIREQLLHKQQELFRLQQQQLELELQQYKDQVEQQRRSLEKQKEDLRKQEDEARVKAEVAAKEKEAPIAKEEPPVSVSTSSSTSTTPATSSSTGSSAATSKEAVRDPRIAMIAQRDPRSRGSSPVASETKAKVVTKEPNKVTPKKVAPKPVTNRLALAASKLSKAAAKKGKKISPGKKSAEKDVPIKQEKSAPREKELPKNYRERSPDKTSRDRRNSDSRRGTRTSFRSRKQRSRSPDSGGRSDRASGHGKSSSTRPRSKSRSPTRSRSKSPGARSPRHDWRKRNYRSRSSNDDDEDSGREPKPRPDKSKGNQDDGQPRSKPKSSRRSSEERQESPPAKKMRQNEEGKSQDSKDGSALSSDLVGLFGSEDQDYRRLPPIPKLRPGSESQPCPSSSQLPLQSPRQEGWARFKQNRPEEFPFSQPRRGSIDPASPEFQTPGLLSPLLDDSLSPNQKDFNVPKPHMLNRAEDILQQADLRLKKGLITIAQYQELLAQMNELFALQKQRVQAAREASGSSQLAPEREGSQPRSPDLPASLRSPSDRHSPRGDGLLGREAFPENDGHFARDTPVTSRPLPADRLGSPIRGHDHLPELLEVPRPPAPPEILTKLEPPERRPTPPLMGRPERRPTPPLMGHPQRRPTPPQPPMMGAPGPMGRVYMDGPDPCMPMESMPPQFPQDESFYVPQFDPRWAGKKHRGKESAKRTMIVVINGRSFDMKPNCVQRIRLGTRTFEIGIDQATREVTFGGECYLKLGQREKNVMMNGRKYTIFARGQSKNIWIDNFPYELFMDAPAEKVLISGKEHMIELSSSSNMVLVDGYEVCRIMDQPQQVNIAFERHEICFSPPPRDILIDGKTCQLDFSGDFPVVFMEGKPHGIRFDGQPRKIWVNNIPYMVDMDRPRRCKPRDNIRPFLLAFGGPGHEVIVEDQWYEVKFNGQEKMISLRDKKIYVRLEGPPPEVKILGELRSPEEMHRIQRGGPHGMPGGMGGPAGPGRFPRVPSLLDLDIKPAMGGSRPGMGPADSRGALGPNGPIDPRLPMGHDRPVDPRLAMGSNGPVDPMLAMGPMGPGPRDFTPMGPGFNPQYGGPGMGMEGGPGMVPPGAMGGHGMGLMDNQGQMNQQGDQAAGSKPVDVNDLLSRLLSAGIIKPEDKKEEEQKKEEKKPEKVSKSKIKIKKQVAKDDNADSDEEIIQEVDAIPNLTDIDTDELKKVYKGVIQQLYLGVQCPSCGIRFTSEDEERYREHLDWHFRQNRRDKDEIKVAKFRRWFYDEEDWVQFEEIGDLEERAYSQFFETMLSSNQTGPGHSGAQGSEVISCPVAKGENDDVCDICGEAFEQFYDDDEEEWHLKDAVRANDKTYHPVCYDDAKETGSVTETEPPTPETPMPDPISDPLGYLNLLSKRNKAKEASMIQSQPAAASPSVVVTSLSEPQPASASSDVAASSLSEFKPIATSLAMEVTPSVQVAAVKLEAQVESTEKSADDAAPPATADHEVAASSGEHIVKLEPNSAVIEDKSPKPVDSGPVLAETSPEQVPVTGLVQVKEEPMDTEQVTEQATTSSVQIKLEKPDEFSCDQVASATSSEPVQQEEPMAATVQVKQEPVETCSDRADMEEPVATGSELVKQESMQTDELQSKEPVESGPGSSPKPDPTGAVKEDQTGDPVKPDGVEPVTSVDTVTEDGGAQTTDS